MKSQTNKDIGAYRGNDFLQYTVTFEHCTSTCSLAYILAILVFVLPYIFSLFSKFLFNGLISRNFAKFATSLRHMGGLPLERESLGEVCITRSCLDKSTLGNATT